MMKKMVMNLVVMAVMALTCSCGKGLPTNDAVKEAIKGILPGGFEVASVASMNELNGLIEVVVKVNGQPVVFYLDKSLKYLVSGSAVELASKKNLTLETQKKFMAAQPAATAPAAAPAKK